MQGPPVALKYCGLTPGVHVAVYCRGIASAGRPVGLPREGLCQTCSVFVSAPCRVLISCPGALPCRGLLSHYRIVG